MSFYALTFQCHACGGAVEILAFGVNKEWEGGIDYRCKTCQKEGNQTFELAYVVAEAARLDKEEVTVQ